MVIKFFFFYEQFCSPPEEKTVEEGCYGTFQLENNLLSSLAPAMSILSVSRGFEFSRLTRGP